MRRTALFASALLLGCSAARIDGEQQHPTATFPAKFESASAPSAEGRPPEPRPAASAPDPRPQSSKQLWQLTLAYEHGHVRIAGASLTSFDEANEGSRYSGRFALELWRGQTLVQRQRFDFPLLAAETPTQGNERPLHSQPLFGPGAEVSALLMVPQLDGVDRAQLVDRATSQVTALPWPPQVQPAAVAAVAAAGGAAGAAGAAAAAGGSRGSSGGAGGQGGARQ